MRTTTPTIPELITDIEARIRAVAGIDRLVSLAPWYVNYGHGLYQVERRTLNPHPRRYGRTCWSDTWDVEVLISWRTYDEVCVYLQRHGLGPLT